MEELWDRFAEEAARAEFRRVFSELPEDEELLFDYFCALDRDFLRQGRLFITSRHLCFYASIFGFLETRVQVPWSSVTNIRKKNTLKIIPNAILIESNSSEGSNLRFCSFFARDKTFSALWNIWEESAEQFLRGQLSDFSSIELSSSSSCNNIQVSGSQSTVELEIDENSWMALIDCPHYDEHPYPTNSEYQLTRTETATVDPVLPTAITESEIVPSLPVNQNLMSLDMTMTLMFIIIGFLCVQNDIIPYHGLVTKHM